MGLERHSHMTKQKANALDALRKLQKQRQELDERESELRKMAAAELGKLLIECGAEAFEAQDIRALMKAAVKLGPSIAIERLSA